MAIMTKRVYAVEIDSTNTAIAYPIGLCHSNGNLISGLNFTQEQINQQKTVTKRFKIKQNKTKPNAWQTKTPKETHTEFGFALVRCLSLLI